MQYQHTNTSHNRTGLSTLAEIAGGAGLRSPQPQQLGLDFVPAQVRSHGLRDAHTYPQVSPDRGKVQRSFRVHASQAWDYPRIEIRAANSWPALTFDCDGNASIEKLIDCATFGRNLPKPNVIVQRKASGNCHASWFLARPVHRGSGARLKPQRRFGRIAEFYQSELCADPGYSGALTLNPMYQAHHGAFKTWWGCKHAYSLDELAEPIPKGWRRPELAQTGVGRNVDLFRALMKWAGSPANIGREVVAVARATNDGLDVPLGDSEVAGLAKSVEGYRAGWIAKGRFYTEDERQAWGRSLGLRGGVVRRAAKAERDRRIIEGREAGFSQRKLARLFGLSRYAIQHVLQRELSGVDYELRR